MRYFSRGPLGRIRRKRVGRRSRTRRFSLEQLEGRSLLATFTAFPLPAADPPTVTTLAATANTITGPTLNASVNPNGSSTDTSFRYSIDATLPASIVTTLAGTARVTGS